MSGAFPSYLFNLFNVDMPWLDTGIESTISRPQIFSWFVTGVDLELKKGDRMTTVSRAHLDRIFQQVMKELLNTFDIRMP